MRSALRNPWTREAGGLAASFAILVVASFAIVRLVPGDPARRIAGPQAPVDAVLALRERLGLDQSIPQQFLAYLDDLAHLRFGTSFALDEPVAELLADRVPRTLVLVAVALVLVLAISIPLGLLLAAHTQGGRRGRLEIASTAVTGLVAATPEFVTGTLLVAVFAVWLELLPIAGATGPQSLVLPACALAAVPAAILTRIVRVEALGILQLDYVRTARLKGLSTLRLYSIHVLPNLVPTVLTVGGLVLVGLAGGTILVENVFAYPGLGSALVSAIVARDYPVIQATILVFGIGVIALNALLAVAVRAVDPRVGRA